MREIKFRAWDKGHKKMSHKVNLYSLNSRGVINKVQIDNKQFMNHVGLNCEIMQFTGLKDKKGKEIFEGDIIARFISRDNEEPEMLRCGEVVFHWGGFCMKYEDYYYPMSRQHSACEVVGNRYENPELLNQ